MWILCLLLLCALCAVLVVLDACRKINLIHWLAVTPYLLVAPNAALWGYWLYTHALRALLPEQRVVFLVAAGIFVFYWWIHLLVFPWRDGEKTGARLKIMIGGRTVIHLALWGLVLECVFLAAGTPLFLRAGVPKEVLAGNAVYGVGLLAFLLATGILRIFFTSRRLSILRRALMLLVMWIPVVNLVVLLLCCRTVYDEYDFACYKRDLRLTRVDSDLCRTRYPLVMVHGVLFRDLKYFNYWGRIPKELTRYGARVYYGNQDAVGTVEDNARDIRNKIREIQEETGCEKVNIIAHSKGGLDARYLITTLGMEDRVASLTTINTPHRGCRFVDYACKMPQGLYRFIANRVDNTFRRMGEVHPDFYTAVRQFTTASSREFNECTPDSPKVYYQSYASKMKTLFGDSLLCVPYCIIRLLEGPNDGLVSVHSAPWGDYRGLFVSKNRRGISHGDIIDLKREDYKGFDVVDTYVQIVGELKNKGF